MSSENENVRLYCGHKVKLLIVNFKNNSKETLALVQAVGRIKLIDSVVPRVIARGKSFLVPFDALKEVPVGGEEK